MRRIAGIIAAALLGAGYTGEAVATATSCGTLITNVATVTMWSGPMDQIGYELSYNVTATVRVVCPVTALVKYADRDVASVGSVVTFFICVVNDRMTVDGSVWNVTLTDRVPANMEVVGWSFYGGTMVGAFPYWNTSLAVNGWNSSSPATQVGPNIYLRWRFSMIGPMKSACATFQARVL